MILLFLACFLPPTEPPVLPSVATVSRDACPSSPCHSERLQAALDELASNALTADVHLPPDAVRLALARAGYAGAPQVLSARGGPDVVVALSEKVPSSAQEVAFAERHFSSGEVWAVAAWSTSPVTLLPLPLVVTSGTAVTLVVGGAEASSTLYHGFPDGTVSTPTLSGPRLLRLDAPGEHRLEVVSGEEIVLLFSVYVGMAVPAGRPLPGRPAPSTAASVRDALRGGIDRIRVSRALPVLPDFPLFQGILDEQAACLGALPVLLHQDEGCRSVAKRAASRYFPRAVHREDLGRGASAEEILDVLRGSPGHLQNLLCEDCSHLAIGVTGGEGGEGGEFTAVLELLSFPSGVPAAL